MRAGDLETGSEEGRSAESKDVWTVGRRIIPRMPTARRRGSSSVIVSTLLVL